MSPHVETVHRSCPICEASCGLRIQVDRDQQKVLRIEGDPDDHRSQGYLCSKAYAVKEVHEDSDRLRTPLRKRADGSWEKIGWEEAFTYATERLHAIRDAYGRDAIGFYIGNPTGHNAGAQLYTAPFGAALATERSFSAGTMDQFPQNIALHGMVGDGWLFPIPDIDRTDFFICMGGNPLASQGSLMSAPNAGKRLSAIRERGGKVVVIDPRRTETAEISSQHIFIRPGSDAYFLFSVVNVLFDEDRVDLGRLADFTDKVEQVRKLAKPFTPKAVAAATGIDPDVTRRLVRDFCAAERAAWYGRIGLCTQEFGTLASYLIYVVGVLTGTMDRVGGMMFPMPATGDRGRGPVTQPIQVGPYKTVKRGIPKIDGQIPCGLMAEEIEEESAGEKRMRALITVAGNPVLSAPNGDRLERALPELDFMISVDIYLNETTRHADLILPSTTQLEHENYDMLFQGTSVRNFARWSPRTFEPGPDQRDHWRILLELAAHYSGATAEQVDDAMVDGMLAGFVGGPDTRVPEVSVEEARAKIDDERGPMRLIDIMIRTGVYGDRFDDSSEGLSLAKLRQRTNALDLGPLEPRLPEAIKWPSQRIDLAPEHIVADVARLSGGLAERSRGDRMVLVGRRQLRNMNSWLHNLPVLARGRNRCTLLISTKDAERLGIADGGDVRVAGRVGEIVVEAAVTDEMMPGVVSLPHGFGHSRPGTRLAVAEKLAPGVCSNLLTDELPLDVPSGTHVANGIPVKVETA